MLGRTGPVSYQVTVDGLIWSRHAGQLLPLIIESRQNQQSQENGKRDTTVSTSQTSTSTKPSTWKQPQQASSSTCKTQQPGSVSNQELDGDSPTFSGVATDFRVGEPETQGAKPRVPPNPVFSPDFGHLFFITVLTPYTFF